MTLQSRRTFIASAAFVTAGSPSLFKAAYGSATTRRSRVFIASGAPDGILAYDWDDAKGELTPAGVYIRRIRYQVVQWQATGEVASFRLKDGKLTQLSARNAASGGTTQIAVDRTGSMAVSADYGGGSATSYKITNGALSAKPPDRRDRVRGQELPRRQAYVHSVCVE